MDPILTTSKDFVFVVGTPSTNTFFVSEAESGTPIVYTDAGTGTHSWQNAIALNRIIEQYDGRARASFSVTFVTTNSLSAVTYGLKFGGSIVTATAADINGAFD